MAPPFRNFKVDHIIPRAKGGLRCVQPQQGNGNAGQLDREAQGTGPDWPHKDRRQKRRLNELGKRTTRLPGVKKPVISNGRRATSAGHRHIGQVQGKQALLCLQSACSTPSEQCLDEGADGTAPRECRNQSTVHRGDTVPAGAQGKSHHQSQRTRASSSRHYCRRESSSTAVHRIQQARHTAPTDKECSTS